MKSLAKVMTLILAIAVIAWAVSPVAADPVPGRDMLKFSQLPMTEIQVNDDSGVPTSYYGHDEPSWAVGVPDPFGLTQTVYNGYFMADDFGDGFDTPVVHVRWWGSYLENEPDAQIGDPVTGGTQKFLIAFEEDVPATAEEPSHPASFSVQRDAQIVTKTVGPLGAGSGMYTETKVRDADPHPDVGESLFEYNAELHLPCDFPQDKDTVYWLKIVALIDVPAQGEPPPYEWGWHNRDYTQENGLASTAPAVSPGEHDDGDLPDGQDIWHFQDDAVHGSIDGIQQLNNECEVHFDQGADYNGDPAGIRGWWTETYYEDWIDGPGKITDDGGTVIFEGIGAHSKDLAFELYTIPEPSALALAAIGLVGLVGLARRRRKR